MSGPSAILWIGALIALAAFGFAGSGLGTEHNPCRSVPSYFATAEASSQGACSLQLPTHSRLMAFDRRSSRIAWKRRPILPTIAGTHFPCHRRSERNRSAAAVGAFAALAALDDRAAMADDRRQRWHQHIPLRWKPRELEFLRYDVATSPMRSGPEDRCRYRRGRRSGRSLATPPRRQRRDGHRNQPDYHRRPETRRFSDYTAIATLDGVKFEVDEARSWFARTPRFFDVIQMSLIDTWAATGAGAFTLTENGLYTVEAWQRFLGRLNQAAYSR